MDRSSVKRAVQLRALGLALLVAGLMAAAPRVHGADLDQEWQGAALHASLAASSTSLDDVHMHVHHSINCLVGPKGAGFDPSQANPCASLGNGVLVDGAASPKLKAAQQALAAGKQALAATTLEAARAAAARMQASLK